MSCMQILFSAGITAKKPTLKNGYVGINISHRRSHVAFKPSAIMMDETSKGVMDVRPPITIFSPSIWGDSFSTSSIDEQVQGKYAQEIEALKKEARSMLMAATSTKLMILIDELERLGLAFHFETEIEHKLKQIYDSREDNNSGDYDLFARALRFRLLRQHQYHVSCNDFDKFVDKENKWNESHCSDVDGLLSLYEAAHVRIHNEHILDEAEAFTTHHLSRILPQLGAPLKEKVQHALVHPLQRSLTVLTLHFHISNYEEDESRDEVLLRLAKLNFNFLQNVYRDELFQLSTWWNMFDLKSKLPHVVRDRLVECYMWALTYHLEPQYSWVRIVVAKLYTMLTIMDDTYDNYSTFEENDLFTQALERWNIEEIDMLPDNIKLVYKVILNISDEVEREAEKQEKLYVIPHYIEAIKQLGRTYGEEQKWIRNREMPTFGEYSSIMMITAFIYITFTAVIPGLKSTSKATVDWLLNDPKIVVSAAEIGRLFDDISSYQRERKGGEMHTIVECYMKDKGVTEEETISAFAEIIEDRWKHVSAEWVKNRELPKEMVVQFVHISQTSEMVYTNYQDGVTSPERSWAPYIAALLLDPLPL